MSIDEKFGMSHKPEPAQRPAAEAIARECAGQILPSGCTVQRRKDAVRRILEAAAAIQRGDGQTKADLALAEEYASAIIRHSESYGSVAKGFALACFDEVIRKAQLLSIPPADKLRAAKPNETSGATPVTDAVAKQIGRLGGMYKGGEMNAAAFCHAVQLEIDKLGSLERELAAVRKSAGAEGATQELVRLFADAHAILDKLTPSSGHKIYRPLRAKLKEIEAAAKSTP